MRVVRPQVKGREAERTERLERNRIRLGQAAPPAKIGQGSYERVKGREQEVMVAAACEQTAGAASSTGYARHLPKRFGLIETRERLGVRSCVLHLDDGNGPVREYGTHTAVRVAIARQGKQPQTQTRGATRRAHAPSVERSRIAARLSDSLYRKRRRSLPTSASSKAFPTLTTFALAPSLARGALCIAVAHAAQLHSRRSCTGARQLRGRCRRMPRADAGASEVDTCHYSVHVKPYGQHGTARAVSVSVRRADGLRDSVRSVGDPTSHGCSVYQLAPNVHVDNLRCVCAPINTCDLLTATILRRSPSQYALALHLGFRLDVLCRRIASPLVPTRIAHDQTVWPLVLIVP